MDETKENYGVKVALLMHKMRISFYMFLAEENNITIEDIEDNLYYNVYHNYWDQVAESEYHNGDYI